MAAAGYGACAAASAYPVFPCRRRRRPGCRSPRSREGVYGARTHTEYWNLLVSRRVRRYYIYVCMYFVPVRSCGRRSTLIWMYIIIVYIAGPGSAVANRNGLSANCAIFGLEAVLRIGFSRHSHNSTVALCRRFLSIARTTFISFFSISHLSILSSCIIL